MYSCFKENVVNLFQAFQDTCELFPIHREHTVNTVKPCLSLHDVCSDTDFIIVPTAACTQRVPLNSESNLPSDGALVFTDRDIFRLRLVPVAEQIQALVESERLDEALLLLDGVHSHHPLDSHKVRLYCMDTILLLRLQTSSTIRLIFHLIYWTPIQVISIPQTAAARIWFP